METGRHICNELKALRRRIADENHIPLETEECTYRGECCGTCTRCDAEVRYLEDALSHRLSIGKAATVAGLALGLAVGAGVQAQNVADTIPLKPLATEIHDTVEVRVTGVVINSKTKEPEPFIKVTVNKDGKMIGGAATNFKGEFRIWAPCKKFGEYEIEVSGIGFKRYEKKIIITEDVDMGVVSLEPTTRDLQGVKVEKVIMKGLIDKGIEADPPDAEYNVNGVKVIVR